MLLRLLLLLLLPADAAPAPAPAAAVACGARAARGRENIRNQLVVPGGGLVSLIKGIFVTPFFIG
jgi:hypothetical protein